MGGHEARIQPRVFCIVGMYVDYLKLRSGETPASLKVDAGVDRGRSVEGSRTQRRPKKAPRVYMRQQS